MRSSALVAASVVLLLAVLGQGAGAQQRGSVGEEVNVDLVVVDVEVTAKRDGAARDLRRGDFELLVDKKPVRIDQFSEGIERSEQLVVVLDERHLPPLLRRPLYEDLADGLESWMVSSGVSVLVTSIAEAPLVVQGFTRDPQRVREALSAAAERPLGPPALREARIAAGRLIGQHFRNLRAGGGAGPLRGSEVRGTMEALFSQLHDYARREVADTEETLEVLGQLVSGLSGHRGTKSFLLVSRGLPKQPLEAFLMRMQRASNDDARRSNDPATTMTDVGSGRSSQTLRADRGFEGAGLVAPDGPIQRFEEHDRTEAFEQFAQRANAAQITVHTLVPYIDLQEMEQIPEDLYSRGAPARRGSLSNHLGGVEILASLTGGVVASGESSVGELLGQIEASSKARYSLAFDPKQIKGGDAAPYDGVYRTLRVKVKGRGLDVRHRAGFVARTFQQRLTARALGTLGLGATEENAHEVAVEIYEQKPRDDGFVDVTLLLAFPIRNVGLTRVQDRHVGTLRAVALAATPEGALSGIRHLTIPLEIPDADLEGAKEQDSGGFVPLKLRPGRNAIVVGLWDGVSNRESFIVRPVEVAVDAAGEGR